MLRPAGLWIFTSYTRLVLFWAETYHQARSMPTGALRRIFTILNVLVYFIQVRERETWCRVLLANGVLQKTRQLMV
jgi:hypothetical protein